MLDGESLHVPADALKCLGRGEAYTWQVRGYDNNNPYCACERSASLPLMYEPGSLVDRVRQFAAVKSQGTGIAPQDNLSLYFDARPGSRGRIVTAAVTGPSGFAPYNFDLISDWYDISTDARSNRGWHKYLTQDPILDGIYVLTITFDDGYVETQTFDLSAATVAGVDAVTMHHEIFENGAMNFYWDLPAGITGKKYQVCIRNMDDSQEFAVSSRNTDAAEMYLSHWDLRALVHGQTYQWFVKAYDTDEDTMFRSDPVTFLYDPFQMFPPGRHQ